MAFAKIFPVRLFQVPVHLKIHFRNWGISHCCSDLHWNICLNDESLYLLKGEYLLDKCSNLHIYPHFHTSPTKYVPTSCYGSGFVASLTAPILSRAAQPQCMASVLKITILAETRRNKENQSNNHNSQFAKIHTCRYRDNLTPHKTKTWVWVWSQDASV